MYRCTLIPTDSLLEIIESKNIDIESVEFPFVFMQISCVAAKKNSIPLHDIESLMAKNKQHQ